MGRAMAAATDAEQGGPPRPNGRTRTEAALEESAVRLLERNGVLAGLNLREVADDAGVNRGLVYQYFGSRRELLRAALKRDVADRMAAMGAIRHQPVRQSVRHLLRAMLRHRGAVRLGTLLVLDGDPHVRAMPLRRETMQALLRSQADGSLRAGDLEAMHTAVMSLVYGYTIYRDHFAAELGIPADQLDSRVEAITDALIAGLVPSG
jgi:AcrR family transcriptional regulator